MILTIAGILVVLWIIGLLAHVAAGFIHILLIVALAMIVWHFIAGRRHTV